jgi:hypothetical protein
MVDVDGDPGARFSRVVLDRFLLLFDLDGTRGSWLSDLGIDAAPLGHSTVVRFRRRAAHAGISQLRG